MVAEIVMIVGLVIDLAMTGYSLATNILSSKTRNRVTAIISSINKVISTNSSEADRMISALQNRNVMAMQSVLLSNPVTAGSYNQLLQDQQALNELATKQNLLKQEMANIQNEANLIQRSTISDDESERQLKDVKVRAENKKAELDKVNGEIINFKASNDKRGPTITTNSFQSVDQNVKGGLQ